MNSPIGDHARHGIQDGYVLNTTDLVRNIAKRAG
jgi:hypothetical protein